MTLLTSPSLEQVEFEPNDRLETASPVDPTGAVNGRFAQDHDRDYFRFTAKKADHLRLLGRTRSLGIHRDLLLRLFDSTGKQLAQGVPTGTYESLIDILFPDDGTYTIVGRRLAWAWRAGSCLSRRIRSGPRRLLADDGCRPVQRAARRRLSNRGGRRPQRLLGANRTDAYHARRGVEIGWSRDSGRQIGRRHHRDRTGFAVARLVAGLSRLSVVPRSKKILSRREPAVWLRCGRPSTA